MATKPHSRDLQTPEYGHPNNFIPSSDVQRYHSLTTLLSLTNFVDKVNSRNRHPQLTGPQYDHATKEGDSSNVRKQKREYRLLQAATEVLVRDEERIVLTLGRKNTIFGVVYKQSVAASGEKWIPVTPATQKSTLDYGFKALKSPGRLFLERTSGSKSGQGRSNDETGFFNHANIILKLLQQTSASKNQVKRNKNDIRLQAYVSIASCQKALRHLHEGNAPGREFRTYMTLSYKEARSMLEKHSKSSAHLAHPTTGTPFTKIQHMDLAWILTGLERLGIAIGPLQEWKNALSTDSPLTYDSRGIVLFQHLLGLVVKNVFSKVEALYQCKQTYQTKIRTGLDTKQEAKKLDKAALRAVESMRMLYRIKSRLGMGNILARHLQWLSRVRDAVRSQDAPDATASPKLEQSDDKTARTNCGLVPELHDIDAAVARGSWHLAVMQYLDLVCTHTDALTSLTWNFGPQTDLAMKAFFNTVKLRWIPYSQQRRSDDVDVRGQSTSAATLRGILASVGRMGEYEEKTGLSDEEIEILKRAIEAENQVFFRDQDSEAVWSSVQASAGTVHPMATMLSYAALKPDLLYSKTSQTSPDLRTETAEGLRHPSREVLDLFPLTIEVMATSYRCCPSCAAYTDYNKTRQYKEILSPTHNATWVPTTLPVYMLKEAAEAMIRYAERELSRRLGEILRHERPSVSEDTEVCKTPLYRFGDYYTFDLDSSDDDDGGVEGCAGSR